MCNGHGVEKEKSESCYYHRERCRMTHSICDLLELQSDDLFFSCIIIAPEPLEILYTCIHFRLAGECVRTPAYFYMCVLSCFNVAT